MNKNWVLAILLNALPLLLMGQSSSATVYFVSGSVKKGMIDFTNIKNNVIYIRSQYLQSESILPFQISRIVTDDGFEYGHEEVMHDDVLKHIFVRKVVQGQLSMYYGNINEKDEIFFIQDSSLRIERIKLNKGGYNQQLKALYPQCAIKKRYGYTANIISKSILEINECKGSNTKVDEVKFSKSRWSLEVGTSFSYNKQEAVERGWFASNRLPTKDFNALEIKPITIFSRIFLSDRIVCKLGLQYFNINVHNDSLYRVIFFKDYSWTRVKAEIDYDIAKWRIPLSVGYHWKINDKSSILVEVGTNIKLWNKIKINKDYDSPFTTTYAEVNDGLKTLNLFAQASYRFRIGNFKIEPFLKIENGDEKFMNYTPEYGFDATETVLKYTKFEPGIAISYKLIK